MIHHYSYHTTVTSSMFVRRLKPTVVVLKESLEARDNFESLFSSVRSTASENDEEEASSLPDKNSGDETIIKWARENKNDWLPIIGCYHALPLHLYGEEIIFQPLEHLQAITYSRPTISCLGLYGTFPDIICQGSSSTTEVASTEEAFSLSVWSTAPLCRGKDTLRGPRLRNLTCLLELWIANCSDVKRLLAELENLAETLAESTIYGCCDLDCITVEGLQNLASLRTLEFQSCRGMTSLSDSPSFLRYLAPADIFARRDTTCHQS